MRRDDSAPFQFPAHLRQWTPDGEMSHFDFHRQRAEVAPPGSKLLEIQRLVHCSEHFPEQENNDE